jgi:hypothetical protein
MSITTILSVSETVGINDHRFVGQVLSRNQRISTSEILTNVPFQFTMKPHNYLLYSQNRGVLATLRAYDKSYEQYINFGVTGWVNYIAYRGDMSSAQIAACTLRPTGGAQGAMTLVLDGIPAIAGSITASSYMVKAGDFLQYDRYTYIATADVQRGVGTSVSVPIHRPTITGGAARSAVIGQYGITVPMGGYAYTGVTFPVVLREYPTYTLVPMTNDSFISWAGDFAAFESIIPNDQEGYYLLLESGDALLLESGDHILL